MIAPVENPRITSGFNAVRNCSGCSHVHKGVDFGVPIGTPIFAPAPGKVVRADTSSSYGLVTVIQHAPMNGQNLFTLYAHQSEQLVKPGDNVTTGQKIGLSGNTGHSTGPHLHWEAILTPPDVLESDPGFYSSNYKLDPLEVPTPQGGGAAGAHAKYFLIAFVILVSIILISYL